MVIMDSRVVIRGANKLMTPKLQRALMEFATMRPDLAPPVPEPAKSPLSIAPSPAGMSNRARPLPQQPAKAGVTLPAPTQPPESRRAPAVPPEIDRLHAAMRKSPIALHVQRLVPLSKGTQLKRYEVLLRLKADNASGVAPHAMLKAAVEKGLGSMIDRRVMTELIGWLVKHPAVWQANQAMFSVNLTSTALHDEHFIKFVELCLAQGFAAERRPGIRN